MRRFAAGLLAALPVVCFGGEGMLGTKAGTPVTTAAPGGGASLFTTIAAVGIVLLLLKYGIPKLAQKFGALAPTTGSVKVADSTPLAGTGLHVIEVRGRTLLVGSTATAVSLIADLTPKPEADVPSAPLFMDMVEAAPPYEPPSADLLARFDRLRTGVSSAGGSLS